MKDLCKIRDLYRTIIEFEGVFMQEYNLSLNEGMLLCTLLEHPRLTSSELSETLALSLSNTSKVIRSVEEKKLISRLVGVEDKRQMRFVLTKKGVEQIKTIKNSKFDLPDMLQGAIGSLS